MLSAVSRHISSAAKEAVRLVNRHRSCSWDDFGGKATVEPSLTKTALFHTAFLDLRNDWDIDSPPEGGWYFWDFSQSDYSAYVRANPAVLERTPKAIVTRSREVRLKSILDLLDEGGCGVVGGSEESVEFEPVGCVAGDPEGSREKVLLDYLGLQKLASDSKLQGRVGRLKGDTTAAVPVVVKGFGQPKPIKGLRSVGRTLKKLEVFSRRG
ncbi:hypothetical protein V5O48_015719 [Marasmius crinis-equi]|uniref:Uncharacterized protein n=1 Tax=Marasmius crinis-equi TaxID=585013 RepID=A0ABR3ETU0_9AGAR